MRVEVGQIVNTHGIKGEIKVKSNSDFTDVRFQPGQVLTVVHNNNDLEYTVKSHRVHKGLHMLTFEGINNINDIEHLKGVLFIKSVTMKISYLRKMNFIIQIL